MGLASSPIRYHFRGVRFFGGMPQCECPLHFRATSQRRRHESTYDGHIHAAAYEQCRAACNFQNTRLTSFRACLSHQSQMPSREPRAERLAYYAVFGHINSVKPPLIRILQHLGNFLAHVSRNILALREVWRWDCQ